MNQYYPDNVLQIPSATPNEKDAAQYMIRHKQKQYNLCGEFCVAYLTQDETGSNNIDEFLDYWQAKDLKWYQQVFKNGLGRTTGVYDLNKMLAAYDIFNTLLFSKVIVNPYVFYAQLEQYQAIVGVHIDYTGYLVGKGIPHWVVLNKITVISNTHAICDIYNPYTNAMEPYTWRELMISTGAYKNGLWVER